MIFTVLMGTLVVTLLLVRRDAEGRIDRSLWSDEVERLLLAERPNLVPKS